MKLRKKWIVTGITLLVIAGAVSAYLWYQTTPQYKARRLVAELRAAHRGPGTIRRFLEDMKWASRPQHRDTDRIAEDIVKCGSAAIPPLLEATRDKNPHLRYRAISLLRGVGAHSPEVIDAMFTATEDPHATVRYGAVCSLAISGVDPDRVRPVVLEAMGDPDEVVRRGAAYSLGEMKNAGAATIAALTAALKDTSPGVRTSAAEALVKVRGDQALPQALPVLLANLGEKKGTHRAGAAAALGRIGPKAGGALPALVAMLADSERGVRGHAAVALCSIDPDTAARKVFSPLLTMLKSDDPIDRIVATHALQKIAKNPDERLRTRAKEALSRIRPTP